MRFPFLGETKEMNESSRRQAGGSYIALTEGITQYELGGPAEGTKVVLIPGFSVPYFIFDPTFEFLTKTGFRVLRYNLYGRGFSDRPQARYDIHFFTRQLRELLEALKFSHACLIGLSMGGSISASFVSINRKMVDKWVLIDPAGVRPIVFSRLLKAVNMPGIGDMLLGLFGTRNMIQSAASDFFEPRLIEQFQANYLVQMQYKGFKRAILSTVRSGMLGSFYATYEQAGQFQIPTLVFWGRQDTTVPFDHSAELLQVMPHARLKVVEQCGHIPQYEKPSEVNPLLQEFLQR